jgi:hypothetical protein
MAASFLVAFALGLAARGGWRYSAGPQLASSIGDAETALSETEFADEEASPPADSVVVAAQDGDREGSLARVPAGERSAPAISSSSSGRPPWSNVRLVVDQGPESTEHEVELPVVEAPRADEDWLWNRPAAVPPDVEQALEQMGHEVNQYRRLVPLQLNDGRWLVVPVDQIEFQPAPSALYQ